MMRTSWVANCVLAAVLAAALPADATSSAPITTVTLHRTGVASKSPETVTFGEPFRRGDLPRDVALRGRLGDSDVDVQFDRKSSYDDGSARFGVVSMRVPAQAMHGASTRTVALLPATVGAPGEPVSLEQLLATKFDAEVSIDVDGQHYTADARRLLGGRTDVWLRGALVSEWLVGDAMRDAQGRAHPHLAAYFHVRAYAGQPISRIRVDVIVENCWARVPSPSDYTYDVAVSIGSDVRYRQASLTHFHHARWHREFWWGEPAALQVTHDPIYLQESRATPRYARLTPDPKVLAALPDERPAPMQNLDLEPRLGRPGAAPWIGPMPRWDTLYAITGDLRARDAVLAYADAWSSYPVHYRDEKTGRPIDISAPGNAYAGMPGAGRGDFPEPTVSASPYGWKSSHSPPAGFMAYIVTGDRYYLDQLEFVANQNLLQEITVGTKRYPSTWPRVIHSRQVRAQAWTLRTLGLAAAYSPDDDPLHAYFANVIAVNLRYMNDLYRNNNALGLIVRENVSFTYGTIGPQTGFAPWQHNFFTFAVGRLVELGFDDARPLFEFVTRWHRGVLVGNEFCWVFAVNYTIGVKPAKDSPLFATFREVYEANVPEEIRILGCGTAQMARAIGKPEGAFNDFLDSPTSYQANQQPAVAMMATLGVAGGREAWKLISTRTHRPRFDDYPNYAVVPRDDDAGR